MLSAARHPRSTRSAFLRAGGGGMLLLLAATLQAQVPPEDETERATARFKAAVVFNFFEFTEWPAETFDSDESPIRVAFIGQSPVAEEFEKATRDRRSRNRPIQTLRLQRPQPEPGQKDPAPERLAAFHDVLRRCHAVFLLPDHAPHATRTCAALAGSPALVFADTEAFITRGGMIELGLDPRTRRIHFTINLTVLEQSPTLLSSKLLRLARTVRLAPPPDEPAGGGR